MRRFAIFTVSLLLVLLLHRPIAAEEKKPPQFDMRMKLEHAQTILDGLVTEDFEKILLGAKQLNKLGERKWLESESVEYKTQNQLFWFLAGTLAMAAEDENIDGATLSYMQMTQSCIHCHKLIRNR